jgi:hypothetical protein
LSVAEAPTFLDFHFFILNVLKSRQVAFRDEVKLFLEMDSKNCRRFVAIFSLFVVGVLAAVDDNEIHHEAEGIVVNGISIIYP